MYTATLTVLIIACIITLGNAQCPPIISRSGWGARSAVSGFGKVSVKPVPNVIIHHTVTPQCKTTTDCKKTVKSIERAHIARDFGDIGYNFLIGGDGNVYEGGGWDKAAAHAKGWNSKSIGISFIGDFRTAAVPTIMITNARKLIKCGKDRGSIKTTASIFGHGQVGSTECPGQKLRDIVKTLG